jgi:hypothetical protein
MLPLYAVKATSCCHHDECYWFQFHYLYPVDPFRLLVSGQQTFYCSVKSVVIGIRGSDYPSSEENREADVVPLRVEF